MARKYLSEIIASRAAAIMLFVLFACATISQLVHGLHLAPKVVGGNYSDIAEYSYAAALSVKCLHNGKEEYWGCGSSILNHYMLLTAGHCMSDCKPDSYITASVGYNNKNGPNQYSVYSYLKHKDYSDANMKSDIALIRLKRSLTFGPKVGRVALMQNPPYYDEAHIAGWGRISENPNKSGKLLKSVTQYVWQNSDCQNMFHSSKIGIICASSNTKKDFPSMGDSGSALVVRGYVQIGIVSFKKSDTNTREVIFYTDTGHFYDWIRRSTDAILCSGSDDVVLK